MNNGQKDGLDTIWIRYRIRTLLYLRLKLHARRTKQNMDQACADALSTGLNTYGIPHNPATLLGVEEKGDD